MKILAVVGSPRLNGNTASLVNAVCKGAAEAGHAVETVNVTQLSIHDCIACCKCKASPSGYCAINDDMQQLYPKIQAADCLIIGTPVFMGQLSGQLKLFFDRWYTFMDANYQIQHLPGKKYVTVTVSAAPAEAFQSLTDYLNYWLGDFFNMTGLGNIVAGGLLPADAIQSQPELLEKAENIGRNLK